MEKDFSPRRFLMGISVYASINIFIGYILYPFIIVMYGNIILNILAIFLVSIISRYQMIIIYDYLKVDWFFIESLKNQSKNRGSSRFTQRIKKYKAIGEIALILVLVMTDSVITVIYFRPGMYKWDGLSSRKVKILFLMSNILGALIAGLGYEFIFYLLKKAGFYF